MRILTFMEGTATRHPSPEQLTDVAAYIPTEGAVERLTRWKEQGAEVCYLTSRCEPEATAAVEETLRRFGFPEGELYARRPGEDYLDVVQRVDPDVLVEDDCLSIDPDEVITPRLDPGWRTQGIVVPEFNGLAHLPDDHRELASRRPPG